MPYGFVDPVEPKDVATHPEQRLLDDRGITIGSYLAHRQWAFLFLPRFRGEYRSHGIKEYFYCSRCIKWYSLNGTSGNCGKHILHKHPELQVCRANEPAVANVSSPSKSMILMLLLENKLPFAAVERPWFRALTNSNFARGTIAQSCATLRTQVDDQMKLQIAKLRHRCLVFDEWTDCSETQYVGMVLHGMGPDGYRTFCLAHWPLRKEAATAENLSNAVEQVLRKFKVIPDGVWAVTDTTNVMPATVALLGLKWMPCFAHLFNLMLQDLIDVVRSDLQPIIDCVKPISCSTKWPKLEKDCACSTLPTFTPTRWFSMWRFLHNAIELRHDIMTFLHDSHQRNLEEIYDNLNHDETWEVATVMRDLCETFKLAVEGIEGDAYGSLGHVWESFRMIEKAVLSAAHTIPSLTDKWRETKAAHWTSKLTEPMREQLRMATILNVGVFAYEALGRDEYKKAEARLTTLYRNVRPESADADNRHSQKCTCAVTRFDYLDLKESQELHDFLGMNRRAMATNRDFKLENWWKAVGNDLYPVIGKVAEEFLTISATSAAAERQFSQSNQLKPKSRHALACLRLQEMVVIRENWEIAEQLVARPEQNPMSSDARRQTGGRNLPTARSLRFPELSLSSNDEDPLFGTSD
jgi:hypothetical protein